MCSEGVGDMSRRTHYGISILLMMFFTVSLAHAAEIYRWTDEKGTVHFTDDVSKIPEQYRDQTKKMEVPIEAVKEPLKETKRIGVSEESTDRVEKYLEDFDAKVETKRQLEKTVLELEEELKVSEDRGKEIEEYERENYIYFIPFRDHQTGKFVPVGSPYYDEKVKLEHRIQSIRSQLESLEEKLSLIQRGL